MSGKGFNLVMRVGSVNVSIKILSVIGLGSKIGIPCGGEIIKYKIINTFAKK